jgi:hypothetical protein
MNSDAAKLPQSAELERSEPAQTAASRLSSAHWLTATSLWSQQHDRHNPAVGRSRNRGFGRAVLTAACLAPGRDRWLLIHDNAEHRRELDGALPPGEIGSVSVTSRWSA